MPINPADIVEYGHGYPAYYTSPYFSKDDVGRMKKGQFVSLIFDSTQSQFFTRDDTNTPAGQLHPQIVNTPIFDMDVSLGLVYNNKESGEVKESLFKNRDFLTDYDSYAPFRESLQGINNIFYFVVYTTKRSFWSLSGYQISDRSGSPLFISGG